MSTRKSAAMRSSRASAPSGVWTPRNGALRILRLGCVSCGAATRSTGRAFMRASAMPARQRRPPSVRVSAIGALICGQRVRTIVRLPDASKLRRSMTPATSQRRPDANAPARLSSAPPPLRIGEPRKHLLAESSQRGLSTAADAPTAADGEAVCVDRCRTRCGTDLLSARTYEGVEVHSWLHGVDSRSAGTCSAAVLERLACSRPS